MKRAGIGLIAAAALTLLLAACGSDGGGTSGPAAAPGGAPPVKENVADAQRRIAGALATGDCRQVNALAPLQEGAASATPAPCEQLKNLTNLEVGGRAGYGDLGGVIDYKTTDGVVSAVLVRDSDGLLHVAFVNPFNRTPTVGTPLAGPFDGAARDAVNALREKNCAAFLRAAFRRFGEGGLPRSVVCQLVDAGGLSAALEGRGTVRLISAGGNRYYAFYGLRTRAGFFTIVMAKESSSVPPSVAAVAPPLPPGSASYGFVQAYLTNPRGPGPAKAE